MIEYSMVWPFNDWPIFLGGGSIVTNNDNNEDPNDDDDNNISGTN
jgi:hypothetical protein